ncbi:unnamed protein product [Orchesella dallaii]|uniref:DUF659 domain-containing protein n=1 Tax=Orchesella dallaii TaxID=48710 RepID=A0ABP1RCJ0_9HEXA
MGKPTDKIWRHWYLQGTFASCNYCKSHQKKHATRCRKHTSNCPHAPAPVRKEFKDIIVSRATVVLKRLQTTVTRNQTESVPEACEAPNNTSVQHCDIKIEDTHQSSTESHSHNVEVPTSQTEQSTIDAVFSNASQLAAPSSYRQKVLDSHVNRLSAADLKELQKLFTKAMISGNVSFNWLQDTHLKTFFDKLGSGFCPPTRWEASHSVLDKLENEAAASINRRLELEWFFSVIPDGWTNIKGLSVVNIMLSNTVSCLFYKSFETGSNSQTGDYLQGQLNSIITEINTKFGHGKIVAIVSDRGSNYLNARTRIHNQQPGILSISCAAHALNLLVGDISKLPTIQSHLNQAKNIIKEIKNSKTKLGEYYAEFDRYVDEEKLEGRSHHKVSLSLPSVTRWFGVRDMLHKLKHAKNVLLRLAIKETCLLSSTSKRTIMDTNFWYKLERLYPLYTVLTNGIFT